MPLQQPHTDFSHCTPSPTGRFITVTMLRCGLCQKTTLRNSFNILACWFSHILHQSFSLLSGFSFFAVTTSDVCDTPETSGAFHNEFIPDTHRRPFFSIMSFKMDTQQQYVMKLLYLPKCRSYFVWTDCDIMIHHPSLAMCNGSEQTAISWYTTHLLPCVMVL